MDNTIFERIKESVRIQDYAESHLERAKRGNKYVCPKCNSGGNGSASSDSAFSITSDGKHAECFACGFSGDIFDVVGVVENLNGKREQLEATARFAGVPIDDDRFTFTGGKGEQQPDYSQGREQAAEFIKDSQERLQQAIASGNKAPLEYILQRGFTPDEMARFGFGYVKTSRADRNGWIDGAGNWANGGRLVLPWRGCSYFYTARAMSSDVSSMKYVKPDNGMVGGQPLENPDALTKNGVFVVEGQLDGYALEAMNHNSIALGGVGTYARTLDEIKRRGYGGLVVLMFDGDEKGRENQAKAERHCLSIGLRCYSADFTAATGHKDVGEAFASNRDAAAAALETIKAAALESEKQADKEEQPDAEEQSDMQDPAKIAAAIYDCEGYEEPTPTGLVLLDTAMNGGLRSGLVVLGATSSAGKTTLVVQWADCMAAHGRPVLFVTIEQSGRELVSKSLSRLMAQRGYKGVPAWAMNSPKERDRWTDGKTAALVESCNEYTRDIAPNLTYLSAKEQPTAARIRRAALEIAQNRGVAPVVIVDYLQLIAPKNERDTDKRTADYSVSELRRLARDMQTPVIAISSLNRTSYSGSIEMESFKESGMIEYGADILLGLQRYRIEKLIDERAKNKSEDSRKKAAKDLTNEFKRKAVRECEIVVLKNRNGALPPEPLPVTFDCASSMFYDGIEVEDNRRENVKTI